MNCEREAEVLVAEPCYNNVSNFSRSIVDIDSRFVGAEAHDALDGGCPW